MALIEGLSVLSGLDGYQVSGVSCMLTTKSHGNVKQGSVCLMLKLCQVSRATKEGKKRWLKSRALEENNTMCDCHALSTVLKT